MEQLQAGIYIEDAYPGVTLGALALSHGTILIDAPPCPEDARSWRAALRNLGSGVNRLLISLDEHLDRTLGVRAMECAVMAHAKTSQLIRNRSAVFKAQTTESGADWEECIGLSGVRWAPPDLTFNQHAILIWNDQPVILEHHPGPNSGAIWVILPDSKIAFIGDAVFLNQPPFLANANLTTWIATLDLLTSAKYRDYLLISGRGGPVASEVIKEQRKSFRYILRRLQTLAGREEPPEVTESLIPKLISGLKFPADREEQYVQRLRHGLHQYYLRHYRPAETTEEE